MGSVIDLTILSREPVSDEDQKKIEDIFRESKCPHESLSKTFERYSGMLGDIIIFDGVQLADIKDNPPD